MPDKKLFGITALFDSPDSILNAAKKIKEAGYKNYDINTPYPIHGMDDIISAKPSKLSYITLFIGFSVAAFILSFMWWTLAINYPLVIGGKPYFPLPAFVPITFEFTVLLGVLSTVFGMIAIAFNLPYNSHPLLDTEYMRNVTSDKYGAIIEAEDPQFDEKKVKDYLMSLGGNSIESIYQPEEIKFKVFEPKFLIFLTIVAVLSAATTYISIDKLMYITPFDFMLNQKKGSAQAESSFFTDKYEMRQPPVGTVARGFLLYEFIRVADTNQFYGNPLLPTKKVLVLGQSKFLTFCSPCHGDYADDNSRLMAQFPPGPTLHSARVISFTDGKIYNIITNGQNVMPSYDSQITREERWSIINYIRVLQRAQNPKPSDFTTIKEFKKESGNVQN
ncbi:MAG: quinol:electron acceptor oxidoreductase subunit ActD [Ignavibacteriaceae bacterium]|jgi:mono/diheme cytochrome c family protein